MFANIDGHGPKVEISNMITFYITCFHTLFTRPERREKVHLHLKPHCPNYNSVGYQHKKYIHRCYQQKYNSACQANKHRLPPTQKPLASGNLPPRKLLSLPENANRKPQTENRRKSYIKMQCRQRIALSTFVLILFLMQAVVSQGHKELWG